MREWPAPTPRDEMLARVVTRGQRIQMMNRVMIALAIAGTAAAGAVGLALGWGGVVSFSRPVDAAAPAGTVTYFVCPGVGPTGDLRAGDRVYLTGQDGSGDWVQMRSPEGEHDRVWIPSVGVDPDQRVDLPVATCDESVAAFDVALQPSTTEVPGEIDDLDDPTETEPDSDDASPTTSTTEPTTPTTSSPTTTPATSVPPTTPSSTTSTTRPPTTTTTTRPPTTTTTAPTTTTTTQPSPSFGSITRSPATIREADATPPANECSGNPSAATTSSISVNIANATSATMSWSVGGVNGSTAMSRQGQTFSAILGPFGETTIPASPGTAPISVTITASGPGGQAVGQTTVTLTHCEPFG